jgi:AraC family ethanolamine operon transcriptional activator
VLDSFDPEAMRETVQRGSFGHILLHGRRFRGQVFNAEGFGARVAWGRYNLPVCAEGSMPSDRVTIGLLLAGSGEARFNGNTITSDHLMYFAEGAELCTVLPNGATWLGLQIDRESLGRVGIDAPNAGFVCGRFDGQSVKSLPKRIDAALKAVESQPMLHDECARRMVEITDTIVSAIASLMVTPTQHGTIGQRHPTKSKHMIAREAADFIKAHSGEVDLRILSICVALGLPVKTMERAFKATYGISPRTYLSLQRMAELRRKLLSKESREKRLTDVYLECGLAHCGRTAAQYRSLYGELPSVTIREAKGRALAAFP